jgi:multidrug resistance efflux pump
VRLTLILVLLLLFPFPAQAQKASAGPDGFKSELQRLKEELIQATKDYKESLNQLLTHYEENVARSRERLKKTKELYEEALIGKRALDDDTAAVAQAEDDVQKIKKQLADADVQIAQTIQEAADEEKLAKKLQSQPAKRERDPRGRIYYVRFIVFGEIAIYDYSGAVRGRVIKQGQRVRYDSRKVR